MSVEKEEQMLRITMSPSLSELAERFSLVAERLPDLVAEVLADAGSEAQAALHDAAPIGEGTTDEHLADSFFSRADSEMSVVVGTDQAEKLDWVRYGTGVHGPTGHRIIPTIKKALYWEGAEHPYTSVAGQRANDFVSPVLDEASYFLSKQIPKLMEEIEALYGVE